MTGIGIDPSTYTGFAVANGNFGYGKLAFFKDRTGFERVHLIANSVSNWIQEASAGVKRPVICIEGYGHGTHGNIKSFVVSVEIGTAIRLAMYEAGLHWYDVPPSVLKKQTTGKGNATKADMAAAVERLWGFKSLHDDVIDAYALARMAEIIAQSGVPKEWKGVLQS